MPLVYNSLLLKVSDMKDIERHPLNAKFVEELLAEWEKNPF
jgi:hypothetical protein